MEKKKQRPVASHRFRTSNFMGRSSFLGGLGSIVTLFAQCFPNEVLRLRANGCNIVGQQLPALLDVTCYVRLHTLLHVVAQSLKPVILLAPYKRTQHCWLT